MRAIRVHETGDASVLQYEDVEPPVAGAGQVLVKIEAAGVNFIDVYFRVGLYPAPLPLVLGQEAAGVVTAVGAGVPGGEVRVGDRVAWCGIQGAYAEFAAVPASQVVVLPEGVSAKTGAAVMLQGMTAHYLTTSTYPLQRGDTCLVHAAAGGVGLLLCQLAKRRGARVIGTVSTREKAELARGAGADEVILYSEQEFVAEVRRLTGGTGVQVVYDSVGRTTFDGSLDCLARRGMMILFGASSGPVPPFDLQVLNRKGALFVTRPSLAHYTATRAELMQRSSEVLGWVRDGTLHVRVGREFPLSAAAAAHRALEGRQTTGKVLLTV